MGGIDFCLAYGLGLLVSGVSLGAVVLGSITVPVVTMPLLAIALTLSLWAPRRWPWGPTARTWLLAGLVAIAATFYITWRTPAPGVNDLSQFIDRAQAIGPSHVLTGQVISEQIGRASCRERV